MAYYLADCYCNCVLNLLFAIVAPVVKKAAYPAGYKKDMFMAFIFWNMASLYGNGSDQLCFSDFDAKTRNYVSNRTFLQEHTAEKHI